MDFKILCINQMSSTILKTPQYETTSNQQAIPTLTAETTTILVTSQTQSNAYQTAYNASEPQSNTSQLQYNASEPQSTTSLILSTTNQKSSNILETRTKTTLSMDQTTIISNTSSTTASQLPGSKSSLYSLSKYIQV